MFRIVTSPLLLRPLTLKSFNTSCTMWISQIKLHKITSRVPTTLIPTVRLSSGSTRSSSVAEDEIDSAGVESNSTVDKQSMPSIRKNYKGKLYTPVDLSTSLDYMNSEVYLNTYQGKPVWFYYRRNYEGHFPPPRTRPNCVVAKKLVSSNPCPICRDEYLILDYRNTELLRQFLNPITLEILETSRTGLCQHQHKKLLLEIAKAQDLGTIETWLPFHLYDYSEYYSYLPKDQLKELLRVSGCGPQNIMDDRGSLDVTHASSADLAELPVNLQNLLGSIHLIPRASLEQPPPPETKIVPPKIPNRYKMEEDHKALVAKRRKSRTLILQ